MPEIKLSLSLLVEFHLGDLWIKSESDIMAVLAYFADTFHAFVFQVICFTSTFDLFLKIRRKK